MTGSTISFARERLLRACVEDVLEHGLAALSLRPLAARVGSSARLLVHHFGSKDGLVSAVLDDVGADAQRAFRAALSARESRDARPLLESVWEWASAPANVSRMRLLLELQVLALQNTAWKRHAERHAQSWRVLVERALPPSPRRRALATACVAVVDGLVVELLVSGDRRGTRAALIAFAELLETDGALR